MGVSQWNDAWFSIWNECQQLDCYPHHRRAATPVARFFAGLVQILLRRETMQTGMGQMFLGWTDNKQAILGLEFDVPVAEMVALQAGYTYFLNGDQRQPTPSYLGGNENDAWNLMVGLVFRPQGRCYYQSYDRPLFDVAHNGSMMIDRDPIVTDNNGARQQTANKYHRNGCSGHKPRVLTRVFLWTIGRPS